MFMILILWFIIFIIGFIILIIGVIILVLGFIMLGFIKLEFIIFGLILGFDIVMLEWYENLSNNAV